MEFAGSADVWNILNVPLMIMAFVSLRQHWQGLWDDRLTREERSVLLRVALFLLLPVIVFFHEMGHAWAIWSLGGKVEEFHYGLMWGFVSTKSSFTPSQNVWIAFAGNFVEILMGMGAIAIAWLAKPPAVVALFTYLGVLAIGGSAVFYPLMSATGLYGDWVQIYGRGGGELEVFIAVFHVTVVLLLITGLTSDGAKAIFAAKTDPAWAAQNRQLEEVVAADPSPQNLLTLGWSYQEAGLKHHVIAIVKRLRSLNGPGWQGDGYVSMLEARMFMGDNRTDEAIKAYKQVVTDGQVDPRTKVEALFSLANIYMQRRQTPAAIDAYKQAQAVFPNLGDAILLAASAMNIEGRHQEALKYLSEHDPSQLFWIDTELAKAWAGQLLLASGSQGRAQA